MLKLLKQSANSSYFPVKDGFMYIFDGHNFQRRVSNIKVVLFVYEEGPIAEK